MPRSRLCIPGNRSGPPHFCTSPLLGVHDTLSLTATCSVPPRQTDGGASVSPDDIIDPRQERRNFRLIVVNGIMTGGPSALFEPNTVIAAFIIHMNGSQALVGLVSGLVMLGWVWPQLFVANWIEPKPKKLFAYRISTFIRLGSLSTLALVMWLYRAQLPSWFIYAMVGLLFIYWSGGGFSAVAWYDVLSKTVYSTKRPVLFAWRQTGAGVVALAAGIVIAWALGTRSGMAFPVNYLFLLVLMTLLMAVGILAFNLVREPHDHHTVKNRRPWGQYIRLGPQIMRHDHNYRRLFLGQVTFALAVMMAPFLVPLLIREHHVDDSMIGVLLMLAAGADLFVNIYWGHLGSRRGNRAVLVVGSKVAAFAPLAALGALFVPRMIVLGADVRIAIVGIALVMCRVAGSGIGVGRMNYLLDIAPRGMRASYVGFMNTFSVVPVLVPLIAGNLIDAVGYLPVFGLAALFGILSVTVMLRLDDVPHGQTPGGMAPYAADRPWISGDTTNTLMSSHQEATTRKG